MVVPPTRDWNCGSDSDCPLSIAYSPPAPSRREAEARISAAAAAAALAEVVRPRSAVSPTRYRDDELEPAVCSWTMRQYRITIPGALPTMAASGSRASSARLSGPSPRVSLSAAAGKAAATSSSVQLRPTSAWAPTAVYRTAVAAGAYATSLGPEPINADREALYRPRPTQQVPARVLAAAGAALKVRWLVENEEGALGGS